MFSYGLLFSRSLIHTRFFQLSCRVALLAKLFDLTNGKYKKSKEIATDSNYLKCHAVLAALHFPLETTASYMIIMIVIYTKKLRNSDWLRKECSSSVKREQNV